MSVTSTHLFCGGGGDVEGFREAGITPACAINHAAPAVATIRANFPTTAARQADINNLDMRTLPQTDVLVGSPICTEASPAGGNAAPRRQQALALDGVPAQVTPAEWNRTRATAYDLIRAAEVHRYPIVCGENVPAFATRWTLFDWWVSGWVALKYRPLFVSFSAAHLSGPGNPAAPQDRRRFMFCFVREDIPLPDLRPRPDCLCLHCGPVQGIQQWAPRFNRPGVRKIGEYGKQYWYVCPNRACRHSRVEPVTTGIRDHIDLSDPGRRIGDGRAKHKFKPYEESTLDKVRAGLERFGNDPFLLIYRNHCVAQSLDEPITALCASGNHHSLVIPGPTLEDSRIRVLNPREKAAAQRFRPSYVITGTVTEQVKQIGNANPVNAAHWLAQRVNAVLN